MRTGFDGFRSFLFTGIFLTFLFAASSYSYAYVDYGEKGENVWSMSLEPVATFPMDGDFKVGGGLSAQLDYQVHPMLEIGVEGFHTMNQIKANSVKFGIGHSLAFLGNATLQIPFYIGDHKVTIYSKNGMGIMIPLLDKNGESANTNVDADNAAILKLGGGLEIAFSEHFSMKFEGGYIWDFTSTEWTLSTTGYPNKNIEWGFVYAGVVFELRY